MNLLVLRQLAGRFERPVADLALQGRPGQPHLVQHAVTLFLVTRQPALLAEGLQAVGFVTVEHV